MAEACVLAVLYDCAIEEIRLAMTEPWTLNPTSSSSTRFGTRCGGGQIFRSWPTRNRRGRGRTLTLEKRRTVLPLLAAR